MTWREGQRSGASGERGRGTQILEAAAKLFAQQPVAAVTVDSVVAAAGVAKGTFYYHFQSMDDLAAAVGAKLAESFDELLGAGPARNAAIPSLACPSPS